MTPDPIQSAIDHLLSSPPTPAVEWLLVNGPIARRLNEEARNDPEGNQP